MAGGQNPGVDQDRSASNAVRSSSTEVRLSRLSEIVRKERKGKLPLRGRIPPQATAEIIRFSVGVSQLLVG